MATFLLVCHDAGGTIPPVLALTEAMVARRHRGIVLSQPCRRAMGARRRRVIVLSQPCVRARASAAGADFVPFSEIADYAPRRALEEQLDIVVRAMTGRSIGDDLIALVREHEVDAVVVDANLAGALAAAESLPQPSIVLLHSMYETYVDTWFGEVWPFLAPAVNETRALF